MLNISWRTHCSFALLFIIGLLGYAYYLEYVQHLTPCPLCIIQRIVFAMLGLFYLLAALFVPGRAGRRIFASLIILTGLLGIAVAARHVWLTNLPPETQLACIPNLDFLMTHFPLMDVLKTVFTGTADCAEVTWRFLGLSLPAWSGVSFAVFTLSGMILLVNNPKNNNLVEPGFSN